MNERSFKPVTTNFETAYEKYDGAGLVAAVLRAADRWIAWRVAAKSMAAPTTSTAGSTTAAPRAAHA